ncbi:SDR family NAD(P)-dependent oxidoreductase [Pararhizobium sp. A13]|uniref:SDR family NAD(P)-dependent oxidoreductase n=1 Tax=Pararhizobium sp. A13 TaxID=3133975 RepID=UPI003250025D
MTRLQGKIAIVTGASEGVGAGIARYLAAEGAAVVLNSATDPEGVGRVATGITTAGGRAMALHGDASKSEDVKRIFRITNDAFGKPDIVVNAGNFPSDSMDKAPEADAHRQFDVDVFGTFLMCQEAARQFGNNGGVIINMSSVASRDLARNRATYSTTKGVVETLTLGLSHELGPRGIRVVSIDPGDFETDDRSEPGVTEEIMRHVICPVPWRRAGEPTDAAVFVKSKQLVVSAGWRGW